jgi:ribonuclease HI
MDFMGGRSANKSSVPYRVVASAKGYDSKVFKNKVGGYVIVYVDGHCFRNGYMGAQAGMGVWFGDGNPLNISDRLIVPGMNKLTKEQLNVDPTAKVGLARRRMKLPSSRSRRKAEEDKDERERAGADKAKFDPELISLGNRAEIMAALYSASIVQAAGVRAVEIRTDSEYLFNLMTKEIEGLKKNGWKTDKGTPVANMAELDELQQVAKDVNARFVLIPEIEGDPGSKSAERLSEAGAMKNIYDF